MQPTPRIELLGVPRLVLQQGKSHLLERHDAALLAWLALHGPTSRNRLVNLLWPDVETRVAQTNLRQRLFRLRRRSGADIVIANRMVALAEGVQHDLVPAALASNDEIASGIPTLLGSHAYDDCTELGEWVVAARERLAGEWRKRLAQQAAQLEGEGRIAEALVFAERLAVEAPTAEHAHRRVMRLHYRRGDRAAALAAFERCNGLLAAQLGIRPGTETRELADLIERSEALAPPVAVPSPVAALRPPRLIGRATAWRAIESAWQQGQAVLLLGEPGIGKSRLAADFAAAHGQPHLHGARPGDAQQPFSTLARLLGELTIHCGPLAQAWVNAEFSRLLPELGPPPAGRLEPLALRRAVAAAMSDWQAHGLAALVIDDLHFADDASLEMLLPWLAEGRCVPYILSVRSDALPPALQAWLRDHRAELCEVTLAPLAPTEIEELLQSLAIPGLDAIGWAPTLARQTGGNPLYILETLKAHCASQPGGSAGAATGLVVPARIGKLLERRLEQLTPAALRLARLAALAGSDFSAELAAHVLGEHVIDLSEPWLELERSHIISDGGFAHDLILDATLRSVPEAIAVLLHRTIAQVLEAANRAPARVAHHWRSAHESARAAPQFEAAARAAFTASRPLEAIGFWDAAADCHTSAGATEAAFRARCEAIAPAIVVCPSEQVAERTEALVAESRTDLQRLSALLARAKHLSTGSAFERTLPVSTEALGLARRLGLRREELIATNIHGVALTMTGQPAAGIALFEAIAPSLDAVGDDNDTCEFLSSFGYALYAGGRPRESAVWVERAVEMSQRLGDINELAINLTNFAGILSRLGQSDRALEVALRAQTAQARLGPLHGDPYAISLMTIGMLHVVAGRFGEALLLYEQALDLARAGKSSKLTNVVEHHLANLFVLLGQPARARQTLSTLAPDSSATVGSRRAILEWRIAAFAARTSPLAMQSALAELGPSGFVAERLGCELAIAVALPAEDRVDLCRRILARARAAEHPTIALAAMIRLADALRRVGKLTEAAEVARAAIVETADCAPHDMPATELWWLAFQVFDAAGDDTRALQALAAGARWVEDAIPHVPDAFRNGYLNRSEVVPHLMAMANRRLKANPRPAFSRR